MRNFNLLESYQGPRDSYIRAMNQHGDSKGKRFLLKRISKVMKSTNGQSWKVERARIRNRHRGFFRIRIRKFQNSNSNRPARGGSIIRDWKANQKTAIKEKSLAKAKSLPVLGIEFCHTTGWYYGTRSLES